MSYMGSQDRFSHTVIREVETDLLAAGDEHKASAVYEALRGVNNADDAIRRAIANIRSGLGRVMENLDNGHHVYEANEVQRAAELDVAIAKRTLYFQQLTGLLGAEKVQDLLARSAK